MTRDYKARLLLSRAAVKRFLCERFPEEAVFFDVVWDTTIAWFESATAGGRRRVRIEDMEEWNTGLGFAAPQAGLLKVAAAIAAMELACLDLGAKRSDASPTEIALAAEARARQQRATLSEDDVMAVGHLFGVLIGAKSGTGSPWPYHGLERQADGKVLPFHLENKAALDRKVASREEFLIFMDDVAGVLYARGQRCGAARRDQCYRLVYLLLCNADERQDDMIVARLLDPKNMKMLYRDKAIKTVDGWVWIARESMIRACGDNRPKSWLQAAGGEVFLAEERHLLHRKSVRSCVTFIACPVPQVSEVSQGGHID